MKNYIFAAVLVFGAGLAVAYASVAPGPYSVNVHFIPPLVAGQCTFGQFWNPPNMTCAMCFCFTGRLSRCVPQPGCNPTNATATTTTTTAAPSGGNPNMEATTATQLVNGSTTAAVVTTTPTTTTTTTTAAPANNPANTVAPPAGPGGRRRSGTTNTIFEKLFKK